MRLMAPLLLAALAAALECAREHGPSPASILRPLEDSLLPVHPSSLLGRGASLELLSAAHSCLPAGSPHKDLSPQTSGS